LWGARSDLFSEGNVPIPLKGQGNPLPPNFPYRGEWILEPRMFLYVPDQAQSTASNAPRFTASLNDNSDDWWWMPTSARRRRLTEATENMPPAAVMLGALDTVSGPCRPPGPLLAQRKAPPNTSACGRQLSKDPKNTIGRDADRAVGAAIALEESLFGRRF
jgi:hypothetical protein